MPPSSITAGDAADDRFCRTELLIGRDAQKKLADAHVMVVGLGAVVALALPRRAAARAAARSQEPVTDEARPDEARPDESHALGEMCPEETRRVDDRQAPSVTGVGVGVG